MGAHHLLHKDMADFVATGIAHLHLDPDNRFIARAMARILSLDDHKLRALRAGTLIYAALLLTEGIGLLLRRRWAEYFTVIVTGSFIPLEAYELARRPSGGRLALIGVNVAVVCYLIGVLRRARNGGVRS